MTRMVRKQLYIDERQDTLLQREAARRGVTQARVIRDAIDEHLINPDSESCDIRALRGSMPGLDWTEVREEEDRM